jgi:hypothetical protein
MLLSHSSEAESVGLGRISRLNVTLPILKERRMSCCHANTHSARYEGVAVLSRGGQRSDAAQRYSLLPRVLPLYGSTVFWVFPDRWEGIWYMSHNNTFTTRQRLIRGEALLNFQYKIFNFQ